jgi:serine/threonine protein kinase
VVDSVGSAAEVGRGRWTVSGYTEVRALGGGGFGEVVLATHDSTGTTVAIKYLHQELLGDPEQAAAFAAEARTLAGLDSPYVVRLYEYVADPAGAAIVMEFVDGATLQKMLEHHGKTTPEAALVVLFGSLLGLAAAHARGVVHRDYKPANVLVNAQGASKLTDFGIAALAGGRPVPAGTLRYMPPEQFEGGQASPAGDVYAATVTFYECLTGHTPFAGRTAQELYDQHKSVPVPLDEVPEPVRPIIARGMAKSPGDRMSDAVSLAAELRKVADGGYGEDWAERGRSHLAEAAALLLALLWPSGSAPAAQGSSVVHTPLSEPANQPGSPAGHAEPTGHGQPQLNQNQTGQSQPSHPLNQNQTGQSQPSHPLNQNQTGQADQHVQHLEHLEHEHAEHLQHLQHIEHVARAEQPGQAPPDRSDPGAQARDVAAQAKDVAADIGTAAVAGAGAIAQRLVRRAKRSERVPRWIRRALPHDAGPRASLAIVACVLAAVIVVIVLISNVATSLTSGSPAPQGASGDVGTGQGGQGGQPPGSAPVSYNPTITGPTYVDMIPSNMIESHVIDVNLTKIVDPAQEGSTGDVVAGDGTRLVALVFQIKCVSGGEYGETEVKITTSDGQSYSPVIASIVGYNADVNSGISISAGQTESIVLPYLLPDGVTITQVQWDPYLYYAGDQGSHGTWTVHE